MYNCIIYIYIYLILFIYLARTKNKHLSEIKKRMQHHHCQAAKLEDAYDHTPTTSSASASASVNTRRTSRHGTATGLFIYCSQHPLEKTCPGIVPCTSLILECQPLCKQNKALNLSQQQILVTNKQCFFSLYMFFLS